MYKGAIYLTELSFFVLQYFGEITKLRLSASQLSMSFSDLDVRCLIPSMGLDDAVFNQG